MRGRDRRLLIGHLVWVALLALAAVMDGTICFPGALILAGASSALVLARAARDDGPLGRAWARLAGGAVLWAAADAVRIAVQPEVPSVADALHLAGSAMVLWAILAISGRQKIARVLDVCIVCLGFGVWILEAMSPPLQAAERADPITALVLFSHPAIGVTLVGCSLHLVLRRSDGNRSLRFLTAALFLDLAAQVLDFRAGTNGFVVALASAVMVLVFGLLGAAALDPDRRSIGRFLPEVPVHRRAVLLALSVVSGPAVLVVHSSHSSSLSVLMALEVVVLACCIAVRTWFLVTALGRAARSDALTGVLTRTGLTFELDHDDGGYGLLFCDVDHFKEINDSLGHEAGDRVLRVVAERIRRQLRSGDLVARFGGDEFVVVCPRLDDSSLERLAERIRSRLDGTIDVGPSGVTPVSVSVGAIRVAPGESFDHALRRADVEMYRVKRDRRPEPAPPAADPAPVG